jgi:hypothetical protein
MKTRVVAALTALGTWTMAEPPLPRPKGPCDIYGAAGTPCVAAHSTRRALYASYNGPLYQVKRTSDSKTLDVGLTADAYANAAAQANREMAMVVSASGGRGGARITIAAPLSFAHAAGAEISGSGITVTTALNRAHASGAQLASGAPTPGAPNQITSKPRM